MKTINLRDYYPYYSGNKFVDVPDEVESVMLDVALQTKRKKIAHKIQKMRAFKAISKSL